MAFFRLMPTVKLNSICFRILLFDLESISLSIDLIKPWKNCFFSPSDILLHILTYSSNNLQRISAVTCSPATPLIFRVTSAIASSSSSMQSYRLSSLNRLFSRLSSRLKIFKTNYQSCYFFYVPRTSH